MKYAALNVPKSGLGSFVTHLTRRPDAWFVECGEVGLVYFTNLVPRRTGELNVLFWDGHLSRDRRDVTKSIVATAMTIFDLVRVQCIVPISNKPLASLVQKIGFTLEGNLRRAWWDGETNQDLWVYGLLREERENWQSIQLMTSLDLHT